MKKFTVIALTTIVLLSVLLGCQGRKPVKVVATGETTEQEIQRKEKQTQAVQKARAQEATQAEKSNKASASGDDL